MWALVRLFGMIIKGAEVSSALGAFSTFAMKQVKSTIAPKQIAKSITRSVAQFSIDSLKTKIANQIPFVGEVKQITNINKAMKSYRRGEGILKIETNLQALLMGDLKNIYNVRCVQDIRKKKVNWSNALKFTTYKNEYGYEPPQRKGYEKKGYRKSMKDEQKRLAQIRKLEAIAKTNEYLASQGFSQQVIKRLNKSHKDEVHLGWEGSNKRFQRRLLQLNQKLENITDYDLRLQRELLAKGVKYKNFVQSFDATKTSKVQKEVQAMLKEAFFDATTSIENLKTKDTKNYNINIIANQYKQYIQNQDPAILKAIDIWLNPQEYYKQYTTTDIKNYMRGNQYTDRANTPQSSWISWAAWIPHYPNSPKGFFMVKIKKGKSRKNPQKLYSFGEMWGTPSITHKMFKLIFEESSSVGTSFWRSYFRKYKRANIIKRGEARKKGQTL